jgi:crotonobetainyl-CoA:carnitine CoA-transferase CaiB-like acyl-CoA transferase
MQQTNPPISFDPAARGPLDSVRVLDLSRLVAGNMLSLQLADFGADVIKVEPPAGDPLREWHDGGHELFWKTYARNKRSIVLNLRHEAARDAPLRLTATADVFLEDFRPGTLEEMGLGPEALRRVNRDLIIVRVSGFGQTGPYAALPGVGTLVEAMAGLAARTGFPDREPVLPPLALADCITGLYGAFATVMALRPREQGPRGQIVDLSLLESSFRCSGPKPRSIASPVRSRNAPAVARTSPPHGMSIAAVTAHSSHYRDRRKPWRGAFSRSSAAPR